LAPFLIEDRPNLERENAYTIHAELQQTMNDLVGIIRKADEIELAIKKLDELRHRADVATVEGGREFNPGWHLAIDLQNMLLISECIAHAALTREESRGGHTRDDFPGMNPEWRKLNLVLALDSPTAAGKADARVTLIKQPVPTMRTDLLDLFDPNELKKYLTDAELPASIAAAVPDSPADQPQKG
jgi:succinate dehydrogenase / fumarate reductase flavoprotein subunit